MSVERAVYNPKNCEECKYSQEPRNSMTGLLCMIEKRYIPHPEVRPSRCPLYNQKGVAMKPEDKVVIVHYNYGDCYEGIRIIPSVMVAEVEFQYIPEGWCWYKSFDEAKRELLKQVKADYLRYKNRITKAKTVDELDDLP